MKDFFVLMRDDIDRYLKQEEKDSLIELIEVIHIRKMADQSPITPLENQQTKYPSLKGKILALVTAVIKLFQ